MTIQLPPGQGRAATLRAKARTSVLDPARIGISDNPIPLPSPSHLACLWCGIAVFQGAGSVPVTIAEAFSREDQPPRAPRPTTAPIWSLATELGQCPACQARGELAGTLLKAHPAIQRRIGGASVALHQVKCALHGLAVLGHYSAAPALPEAVLMSVLRHLSGPGAEARWQSKFSPVLRADARPDSCGPFPWSHVRGVLRLHLRDAYGAVLADRVARSATDVLVSPPEPEAATAAVVVGGACLLCGTASVTLPAATVLALGGRQTAKHSVWQPLTTTPGSLGGPASPDRIAGYACPDCADALESEGAVGPSAMERALIAHLRSSGRDDDAMKLLSVNVEHLAGWGAIAYAARRRGEPAPAADRVGWSHIRLPD